MINDHFLMSLIQQTSDFIDLVKTKSIEVVAQHDERLLITILMLLFVCYILIFFSGRLWKKRKNKKLKKVLTRSMSIGLLHGGELALKRLIDYHKAKADFISLNSAETDLDALLNEEQPHFKKLQVSNTCCFFFVIFEKNISLYLFFYYQKEVLFYFFFLIYLLLFSNFKHIFTLDG